MRDSEIVASIVAGDPDGLAAAYDRYADALYGYCRSLLSEPADAADAVQDTFVIAASRLAGLRDPDRLRAWLYAVARDECLRRLRSRAAAAGFAAHADYAERPDEAGDPDAEAERAQTRELLGAALGGLALAERDVMTQLWHGLDAAEVALVLGVSRSHAQALVTRAHRQLAMSVTALLAARSGRGDCAALGTMLAGWDGQLTVPLRRRLWRHVGKCPACAGRQRRATSPALLLSLPAGALFGGAAAAGLRDQALRMASGTDLSAQAYRDALDRSLGTFGKSGFPKPLPASHHGRPHAPRVNPAVAAVAVAVAVTVTVIVLAMPGGPRHVRAAGSGPATSPPGSTPAASAAPSGKASSGGPGLVPVSLRASVRSPTGSAPPGAVTTPASAPASGPASPPVTGSPSPAPSPQPTSTGQPSPTGHSTPTSPPSSPGTLAVAPTTIPVIPLLGSTLTLTAENGPVTWSISVPASVLGVLTVSPSSGTLDAGQSVQVTIAETGLASLDTTLTVNPGGQQVTVLGLG